VVAALCVLHNVLVSIKEKNDPGEVDTEEEEEEEKEEEKKKKEEDKTVQEHEGYYIITARESCRAAVKQDEIAEAMWKDYQTRKEVSRAS
jgi:hypothetical protein